MCMKASQSYTVCISFNVKVILSLSFSLSLSLSLFLSLSLCLSLSLSVCLSVYLFLTEILIVWISFVIISKYSHYGIHHFCVMNQTMIQISLKLPTDPGPSGNVCSGMRKMYEFTSSFTCSKSHQDKTVHFN